MPDTMMLFSDGTTEGRYTDRKRCLWGDQGLYIQTGMVWFLLIQVLSDRYWGAQTERCVTPGRSKTGS